MYNLTNTGYLKKIYTHLIGCIYLNKPFYRDLKLISDDNVMQLFFNHIIQCCFSFIWSEIRMVEVQLSFAHCKRVLKCYWKAGNVQEVRWPYNYFLWGLMKDTV